MSISSSSAPVFNPATGAVTGRVTLSDAAAVNAAVRDAQRAFPAWADTPPLKRARILFRFLELLRKHSRELALSITAEHGKVLADAEGEVQRGTEVVEFATGIPYLLKGDFSDSIGADIDSYALRQPLGTVAGITPFNFPAMVPLWMFPIAIACGNCFVLKPSERAPGPPRLLAQLLHDSGLPEGVFTLVNGDRAAVDALIAHPDIAALSFVGSTPVAEHIYAAGTAAGKRVQALGGAKNHMVILPDADLDQAATALMGAAFGAAGERCMAVSVAVAVGDAVGDALIGRLKPMAEALKVGPGDDPASEMGPLITAEHRDRVRGFIDAGLREGAQLVVDGRAPRLEGAAAGGYFLGASLFDRVTPDMSIYREEIFGPVLSLVRVPTLDDAVRLINAHAYGNGAVLFTRSGAAARQFSRCVRAGMVGINVPLPVPAAFHSFGGWKRSLFGDMHMHGAEGVRFFTRLKTITTRWPQNPPDGAEYHFPQNA